jgi:general secretion pathway protein A
MYESYFKFEKSPFKVVPDPSMLFVSRGVREAMGRIEFAVRTGKGITVMTGEVGTGKTTLVNRFLDKAGPDTQTAYIFNPTLSGLQLLKTLADELGVQTAGMAKVDLTRALYELLLRNRQAGRRTIVFVDEAQALSREALEELRLISNLETWQEKLLHLFLVGQPELLEKLASFNLRQLRQRVELFVHIEAMSPEETRQYIEHRIRLANPLREVTFSEGACAQIHRLAAGIPRTINILCDASLLVAYVAETLTVTPAHVREALRTIDGGPAPLRGDKRVRRGFRRLWAAAGAVAAALLLVWALDTAASRRAGRTEPRSTHAQPAAISPGAAEVQAASRALVHVRSCAQRAEAEAFAAALELGADRRIYLQTAIQDGTEWVRVLVGDFADPDAAAAWAGAETAAKRLRYARAVQIAAADLEPWRGAGSGGGAAARHAHGTGIATRTRSD